MTGKIGVRRLAWVWLLVATTGAALAQAMDGSGVAPPDPVLGIDDLARMPAASVEADRIVQMIEQALQGDANTLERIVALGAQPDLADSVARALATVVSRSLEADDTLAASRIQTAVAMYGSVALADRFNTDLAARTAQTADPATTDATPASPEDGPITESGPGPRVGRDTPPGRRPVTGFASHGAPIREMGPTH